MLTASLPKAPTPGLINWKIINTKIPWGLIFLLGGGFALAEGGKVSGMSAMLGQSLVGLKDLPPFLLLFIVCLTAQILTEFTSNVAIANILLPVLAEMSIATEMHPLYLMFPAALSCCMAFHMPVGTPPNAIVASVVHVRTKDMVFTDHITLPPFVIIDNHYLILGFCWHRSVHFHPARRLAYLSHLGSHRLPRHG